MKSTSNWLETWARFKPKSEALYDVSTGKRWTYEQMHKDSLAMAQFLYDEGIRHGDRVAVLAFNRGETLVLFYACAFLGAIMVPFNWRLSNAELKYQIGDCKPTVLFCDETYKDFPHMKGIALDSFSDIVGEYIKKIEPHKWSGSNLEDPWAIMYTSGSTGKPKGALLTHLQVFYNAVNTILACNLEENNSTLTFTPLFHTGGLNCLTTPMFSRGGRVILTPGFDPEQSFNLIKNEKITNLIGVPTIYQMLADHPSFEKTDFSFVKDALCGGAVLSPSLLERYFKKGIPLRQGFGLTEVGPNCFSMPPIDVQRKPGSVGKVIHHLFAKIVRPDGSECEPEEAGELVLSGPTVCGGYWNNKKATEESIKNGWFHTGDVLYKDKEGFFFVQGRIKEMYISGGENVYPAEVESAILQCPGVAMAAVISIADDKWGEVGVAFIEPQPEVSLTGDDIKIYIKNKLAKFKHPKKINILSELPKTASGKIDKPKIKSFEG